ncbi:MAG: DNA repair protein RadA [Clostridia bacterium]|nr:DNA repair protein RadA [Clostridia bacterium]
MASKTKTQYICSECGYQSMKWLGKCPGCGKWNTLTETVVSEAPRASKTLSSAPAASRLPRSIGQIQADRYTRYSTGIGELDRVLGGGIVRGSLILVGGDPGIGKSTLLLQICENASADKKILYVSGEESEGQIKIRAERLGVKSENLYLVSETDIEIIIEYINGVKPDIVIIDSIQTMHRQDIASAPGSVPQVREATNLLMYTAKQNDISMFIVGHVTKDGSLAGPRVLEHMVDCVLYFEGDRQMAFRILRCVKNRFGSTNEIGVFEMQSAGLAEVENPSALFLDGRQENTSGSAIICTMEGSRGVLAEIQALVTPTGFGNPRRMSSGIDINKLILMIAVLEKRAGVRLANYDVYVNVAGGLRIDETAIDLGLCAAIATGLKDISIPPDMVFMGEVGLGGELRSISRTEKRLTEAAKLGFTKAIVPKASLRGVNIPPSIKVMGVSTLREALAAIKKSSSLQ